MRTFVKATFVPQMKWHGLWLMLIASACNQGPLAGFQPEGTWSLTSHPLAQESVDYEEGLTKHGSLAVDATPSVFRVISYDAEKRELLLDHKFLNAPTPKITLDENGEGSVVIVSAPSNTGFANCQLTLTVSTRVQVQDATHMELTLLIDGVWHTINPAIAQNTCIDLFASIKTKITNNQPLDGVWPNLHAAGLLDLAQIEKVIAFHYVQKNDAMKK